MSDSAVDRPIVDADKPRPVESDRPETSRTERARLSAFRSRFAAVYLVLAVVAGAAIGSFVVIMASPDPAPEPPWSASSPSGTTAKRLRWIAAHVGARYRFPDGTQLVQAVATRPSLPNEISNPPAQVPLVAIVERPNYASGDTEDFANAFFDPQTNAQFTLCGLGENCAFPATRGESSRERFLLLEREALELGLFTFRHVPEIQSVTVFFPPRVGAEAGTGTVALLRRRDYRRQLSEPLSKTLAPLTPRVGDVSSADFESIYQLTNSRLFTYTYRQTQDNAYVLIVDPLANVVP